VLSDGPYLWVDRDGLLSARSLPEFGAWKEIHVTVLRDGREETLFREPSGSLELHRRLEVPSGAQWIRAEGLTVHGRTALTQIRGIAWD
jgi:hypothetical protein